jgi:hypothetical protein
MMLPLLANLRIHRPIGRPRTRPRKVLAAALIWLTDLGDTS